MGRFLEYIKSLVKANTLDSSKSFGLLCSILTGSLLCVCVCFCLIWDVCTNGYIKTDLESLGWFLVGIGLFMAGGSVPKTVSDVARRKKTENGEEGNKSA